MSYEDDCAFIGLEFCEECLEERNLDMAEEEAKFFDE